MSRIDALVKRILPLIAATIDDRSWRVRWTAASKFADVVHAFKTLHGAMDALVPNYEKLLQAPEAEVLAPSPCQGGGEGAQEAPRGQVSGNVATSREPDGATQGAEGARHPRATLMGIVPPEASGAWSAGKGEGGAGPPGGSGGDSSWSWSDLEAARREAPGAGPG